MTALRTMFAAVLLALALPVTAQPYVFAGYAFTKGGEKQSDGFVLPGIGYQFSERLAIEASIFEADIDTSSSTQLSPTQIQTTERNFGLQGAAVSLVGTSRLSHLFSLTGSASVYRLRGKMNSTDTLRTFVPPSSTVTGSASSSGSDTTFGIGIGLSVTPTRSIDLRARMDWMAGKSDLFGPGQDLEDTRTFSLTAVYRF